MKRLRILPLLLLAVALAGCQTVNRQDRAVLQSHDVPQDVYDRMLYGDPLSLGDVITLSRRAVPSGLIIKYMDNTDCAYRLQKSDVKRLRAAGVSEEVISYMLSTAPSYSPTVYRGEYPYPVYPYPYPYDPYYYGADWGPVVVGGGYGWWHRGGHGGWDHGGHDHGGPGGHHHH